MTPDARTPPNTPPNPQSNPDPQSGGGGGGQPPAGASTTVKWQNRPVGYSIPQGATPQNPTAATDAMKVHRPKVSANGRYHIHEGYAKKGKEWWQSWHEVTTNHERGDLAAKGVDEEGQTQAVHEEAGLGRDGRGGDTATRAMTGADSAKGGDDGGIDWDRIGNNLKQGAMAGAVSLARSAAMCGADLADRTFAGLRRAMRAMMSPNPMSEAAGILTDSLRGVGDISREMTDIQRRYGVGNRDSLESTLVGRIATKEMKAVQDGTAEGMGFISEAIEMCGADDISSMDITQLQGFANTLNARMVPLMRELAEDQHKPPEQRMPERERKRRMAALKVMADANSNVVDRSKEIKSHAKEYAARLAHEESIRNQRNAALKKIDRARREEAYRKEYDALPPGGRLARTLQGRKVRLDRDGIAIARSQRTAQKRNALAYADHIEQALAANSPPSGEVVEGTGLRYDQATVKALRDMAAAIEARERQEELRAKAQVRQRSIIEKNGGSGLSPAMTVLDQANALFTDKNGDEHGIGHWQKNTPQTRDRLNSIRLRMESRAIADGEARGLTREQALEELARDDPDYREIRSVHAAYADAHIVDWYQKQMNSLAEASERDLDALGTGATREGLQDDIRRLGELYDRCREASPVWDGSVDHDRFDKLMPDEDAEREFRQEAERFREKYNLRPVSQARKPAAPKTKAERPPAGDGDADPNPGGADPGEREVPWYEDYDNFSYTTGDGTVTGQSSVPYDDYVYEYPEGVVDGEVPSTGGFYDESGTRVAPPAPAQVARGPQSMQDVRAMTDDLARRYGVPMEGDFGTAMNDLIDRVYESGDPQDMRSMLQATQYMLASQGAAPGPEAPQTAAPRQMGALRRPAGAELSPYDPSRYEDAWSAIPHSMKGRGNSPANVIDRALGTARNSEGVRYDPKSNMRVDPAAIDRMVAAEPARLSDLIENFNYQGRTGLKGADWKLSRDTETVEERLREGYGIDTRGMSPREMYSALYNMANANPGPNSEYDKHLAVTTDNALAIRDSYGRVISPMAEEMLEGGYSPYAYESPYRRPEPAPQAPAEEDWLSGLEVDPATRKQYDEIVENTMRTQGLSRDAARLAVRSVLDRQAGRDGAGDRRTPAGSPSQHDRERERALRDGADDLALRQLRELAEANGLDPGNAARPDDPDGLARFIGKQKKTALTRRANDIIRMRDGLLDGTLHVNPEGWIVGEDGHVGKDSIQVGEGSLLPRSERYEPKGEPTPSQKAANTMRKVENTMRKGYAELAERHGLDLGGVTDPYEIRNSMIDHADSIKGTDRDMNGEYDSIVNDIWEMDLRILAMAGAPGSEAHRRVSSLIRTGKDGGARVADEGERDTRRRASESIRDRSTGDANRDNRTREQAGEDARAAYEWLKDYTADAAAELGLTLEEGKDPYMDYLAKMKKHYKGIKGMEHMEQKISDAYTRYRLIRGGRDGEIGSGANVEEG